MQEQALDCGVPLNDILRMTPAEVIKAIEASHRRALYLREEREKTAWLVGCYVRYAVHADQYPPPPVGEQATRQQTSQQGQTVEEMKAVMRGLANRGRG